MLLISVKIKTLANINIRGDSMSLEVPPNGSGERSGNSPYSRNRSHLLGTINSWGIFFLKA